MSQTWHLPLLTTDTLSDSRGYLDDALEALRTMFSGSSAPSTPVAGQLHYDTDDNVIRVYNGTAWKIVGDADSDYLAMLPLAAGASYPLAGDLYMGSYKIKNLANPAASGDGMNLSYADATYAKLAGATFTGAVAMGSNKLTSSRSVPDDDTEFIRKDYADTKLPKAGGGMTGNLDMNNHDLYGIPTGTTGTSGDKAANLAFVRNYFDTSTGHDHDGGDSKRVLWTNVDTASATVGQVLRANGSGGVTVSDSSSAADSDDSPSVGSSYSDICEVQVNIGSVETKVYLLFTCSALTNGSYAKLDIRIQNAADTTLREKTAFSVMVASADTDACAFSRVITPGAVGAYTITVQLKYQSSYASIAVTDAVLFATTIG